MRSQVAAALFLSAALLAVTTTAVFTARGDAHEAPEPARLRVVLNATGGDATFDFLATGEGIPPAFNLTTVNGTADATFANLTPNRTYTFDAQALPGWDLASATCSAGAPDNITPGPGDEVTCWFEQVKRAQLTLRVESLGGNGTFTLLPNGSGLPASLNLTTTNGTTEETFANLTPQDNVSILAQSAQGWNLTAATCDDASPDNLTLAPGADVTCTFTYARLNALHVRVHAAGGATTFFFDTTGEGLPTSFNLTPENGTATRSFEDLPENTTFSLDLDVPPGWRLTTQTCDPGAPDAFHLDVNETAVCDFHVARLATLRVELASEGGNGTFRFDATGGTPLPASFPLTTVAGAANTTFGNLTPDHRYTLALRVPAGWSLAGESCTAGAPGNLTLAPGTAATCRFEITRFAQIRGFVFHDENRNGTREIGDEPGLRNWTLYLDTDGDRDRDAHEPTVRTNDDGFFAFRGLEAGTYDLVQVTPSGWRAVAPNDGVERLTLAAGQVESVELGNAPVRGAHDEGDDEDGHGHDEGESGGRGPGFWRNWDHHDTYSEAQLDGWVAAIHAESAWLMPAGYDADADGMAQLLEDSTRHCPKKWGKEGCERVRLEAAYLVLRLNLAAGLVDGDGERHLNKHAAERLGLGREARLDEIVDAFEDLHGSELDRKETQHLRSLMKSLIGESD